MRQFGLEISGNARSTHGFRKDLTPTERAAIVAARAAGVPRKVLAQDFDCRPETISRTVKRFQDTNTYESKPRSGRPCKLSHQQRRYILQIIKRNRRMTWAAVVEDSPTRVHKNTIRRILGKHLRRKWRAIKRIQLTSERAASRLAQARYWREKSDELIQVWQYLSTWFFN